MTEVLEAKGNPVYRIVISGGYSDTCSFIFVAFSYPGKVGVAFFVHNVYMCVQSVYVGGEFSLCLWVENGQRNLEKYYSLRKVSEKQQQSTALQLLSCLETDC